MVHRVGVVVDTANTKLKTKRVSLTKTQKNREGFLFPSTYAFDVRTTGANLVANQVATFCSAWGGST